MFPPSWTWCNLQRNCRSLCLNFHQQDETPAWFNRQTSYWPTLPAKWQESHWFHHRVTTFKSVSKFGTHYYKGVYWVLELQRFTCILSAHIQEFENITHSVNTYNRSGLHDLPSPWFVFSIRFPLSIIWCNCRGSVLHYAYICMSRMDLQLDLNNLVPHEQHYC